MSDRSAYGAPSGEPWWKQTWAYVATPLVVIGGLAALGNAVSDDGAEPGTSDTVEVSPTASSITLPSGTFPPITVPAVTSPGETVPALTVAETIPGATVAETALPTIPLESTTIVETTAPPAQPGQVGSKLSVAADVTTLDVTVLQVVDPAPAGADALSAPQPGNRWVAVEVMVANVGTGTFDDLLAGYAKVIDTAGEQWLQAEFGTTPGPELGYLRLRAGDSRLGWVTFELPQAASLGKLQLVYASTAEWSLASGSPTGAPVPALAPGDARPGVPVRVPTEQTEVEVSALQVVDPATPSVNSFSAPGAGHHFVAVQLRVTNVGAVLYDAPPAEGAAAVDSSGFQYDADFDAIAAEGPGFDEFFELAAGETAEGFIVFEVPDGSRLVKVQFSPDYGFTDSWLELDLT